MTCAKVRRELERRGLLLLQDKKLPSIATIFAGAPMSKSWWAHPQGRAMFQCLASLEGEAVVTRLIGGKVTYVHKRLWSALAATKTPVEDDVHTESGRHEKRVERAEVWCKRLGVKPLPSVGEGRAAMESAASTLGAPLASLPWHR